MSNPDNTFRVPITEGIRLVRETVIKTDEDGQPLRSQPMPKYIPREPQKTTAIPSPTARGSKKKPTSLSHGHPLYSPSSSVKNKTSKITTSRMRQSAATGIVRTSGPFLSGSLDGSSDVRSVSDITPVSSRRSSLTMSTSSAAAFGGERQLTRSLHTDDTGEERSFERSYPHPSAVSLDPSYNSHAKGVRLTSIGRPKRVRQPAKESTTSLSSLSVDYEIDDGGRPTDEMTLSPKGDRPVNIVGPIVSEAGRVAGDWCVGEGMGSSGGSEVDTLLLEEMRSLHVERDNLRETLQQQIKVNGELKKLLVASLGNDLQYRMEKLAQDKAHLTATLGTYTKKITEDYEDFDRISIQADMWRSKYHASKMMVEELASMKAELNQNYMESVSALQALMEEREELHTNLAHAAGSLKKESSRSYSSFSTSGNQSVVEISRFLVRSLTGGSAAASRSHSSGTRWQLTPAESLAHQVLSTSSVGSPRPLAGWPGLGGRQTDCNSLSLPRDEYIHRYHRYAKYDGLLFACCSNCSGEMVTI